MIAESVLSQKYSRSTIRIYAKPRHLIFSCKKANHHYGEVDFMCAAFPLMLSDGCIVDQFICAIIS